MNSLFDETARSRLVARIEALDPDAPRGWGKMNPAQALAHCAQALESATGDKPLRQKFMGKILAPFVRGQILGDKPFSKDSPTDPSLIVSDVRDFAVEKARLLADIRKFAAAGPGGAAKYEHGFLGRITGEEWGVLMHKHVDHHLMQFGR